MNLSVGDYVLASKYRDGDPCDHFAVGFFSGMFGDRYMVMDEAGNMMRANGFRRCERISERVGRTLVAAVNAGIIGDIQGRSVWYWRFHPGQIESMQVSVAGIAPGHPDELGQRIADAWNQAALRGEEVQGE